MFKSPTILQCSCQLWLKAKFLVNRVCQQRCLNLKNDSPKFSFLVEDYPSGYPRFSGLIGAHSAFSLFRRFSVSRARLLLVKQDRVCVLEKQLEELDQKEQRPLFLGTCRQDRNLERKIVLEELDRALADYGKW